MRVKQSRSIQFGRYTLGNTRRQIQIVKYRSKQCKSDNTIHKTKKHKIQLGKFNSGNTSRTNANRKTQLETYKSEKQV